MEVGLEDSMLVCLQYQAQIRYPGEGSAFQHRASHLIKSYAIRSGQHAGIPA
jgi:hypothetical protein